MAIDSFEKAKAYLAGGRNPVRRPCGNNTAAVADGDAIGIQLHSTIVVRFLPDGNCELNSGGWRTVTTKARINRHSPARVSCEKGTWYVTKGPFDQLQKWEFFDGMIVDKNGIPMGSKPIEKAQESKARKERSAVNRKIKAYADGFLAAIAAGEVDNPSAGDCFCCQFKAQDGKLPLGGAEHIVSHMAEKYFVPSLLMRSIERFPVSIIARQWLQSCIVEKKPAELGYAEGIAKEQVGKSIRRFCAEQMGLQA